MLLSRREFLVLSGMGVTVLSLPDLAWNANGVAIPVLLYHDISNQHHDKYTVSPGQFAAQMEWLYGKGYQAVSIREAAERRSGPPERLVVITFDDGYASFVEYAFSLLEEYGFSATIAVIGRHVGGVVEHQGNRPMLSWDEYRFLLASGRVEIACHLHDLHAIELTRRAHADAVAADLETFQRTMDRELGQQAVTLAWPYGIYDAGRIAVARRMGFRYMLTSKEGFLERNTDLLEIPRLTIGRNLDLVSYQQYLEGK